jgi:hypothetical protein
MPIQVLNVLCRLHFAWLASLQVVLSGLMVHSPAPLPVGGGCSWTMPTCATRLSWTG